jgi:DNA-cytosine methyltransferase
MHRSLNTLSKIKNMCMEKRHIDLCAGIGAMTMALREHGYQTIMACDISQRCHETYVANHGSSAVWEDDVFKIRELPPCEVLTAGAPCQSFSSAGKRRGFSCPINGGVFAQILNLVEHASFKPRIVVLENVLGLQTIDSGKCFRKIVEHLRRLDYVVRTQRVDAEDWGSPTTRSRIFIVARLRGAFKNEELPPFPKAPMIRGRVRDHLSHMQEDDYKTQAKMPWMKSDKYTIMPEEDWHRTETGKVMVGYVTGRKLKRNLDPKFPSTHSQSTRIYHADGVYECIGRLLYPVYLPGMGVRKMSVQEVGRMMGLPQDFRHHESRTHSRLMVANTINMYALKPVIAWTLTSDEQV